MHTVLQHPLVKHRVTLMRDINTKSKLFHDHTNTLDGMDRNGIRLGMTKSFNCGGSYGDREPGFRVFRVRRDGSFESWTETENTLRRTGMASVHASRNGSASACREPQ